MGTHRKEGTAMEHRATLSVIAAAALWGLISLFVKGLTAAGLDSMQIVAVRCILGAVVMVLVLAVKWPDRLKVHWRDLWYFIGTGIFSLVFFNWCYFTAIRESAVSVAVVLLYTSPIFVTLLSALLFREPLTGRKLAALALTFVGCVLVAGLAGGQAISLRVLLIGLGSGLGYGLYSIFGRVALRKYDTLTVTTYTFLFSCLGVLPLCRPAELFRLVTADGSTLFMALAIALLCTVAPYLLYTWGLQRMETGRAAILATVEPLVGALLGLFLYREDATPAKLAGMALIFLAVFLLNSGGKPGKAKKDT